MSKRRIGTMAAVALLAVLVPVVSVLTLAPGTAEPPASQQTTGTENVVDRGPSLEGNATAQGDPDALPKFDDRMLVPVIDIDIASMIRTNEHSIGLTGPPWRPGATKSTDDLFTHPDQERYFETLVACFPDVSENPSPEDLYQAAGSCFDETAINLAVEAPDPTDLFVAFRALAYTRPETTTVCHNAAHRVGEIALRRVYAERGLDADSMYRLLQLGLRSCLGGLIHGVYDAIGYMQPSMEEFKAAVDVCEQDGRISGQCADAVGHASWDGTGDVALATQVCGFWEDISLQGTCIEGIVMRMYQRLEKEDQWYTGANFGAEADRYIYEAARVCDQFPTDPVPGIDTENPANLCHQGIVYLLVKPMYAIVERNGGDYLAEREEIHRLIGVVVDACDTFGPEGSKWCTDHVGTFLPGVAWFDEAQVEPLCMVLGRNVEKCIADGALRIENTLLGKA